jgi:hypothetical protein
VAAFHAIGWFDRYLAADEQAQAEVEALALKRASAIPSS